MVFMVPHGQSENESKRAEWYMYPTRTLERGVIIVIIVKDRWYPPVILCRQKTF